ncbi:hypothetical protein ACFODZ_03830 [Marinicella sediminis]|uniref:Carbohydrate-binding domain-containing protein n=1 Tax=Marinicella sediminis TaxID=1792834 RepID=A0ABV7J5M6_9GAMM|nr:hypothetical protein [Marinicella sediminis]
MKINKPNESETISPTTAFVLMIMIVLFGQQATASDDFDLTAEKSAVKETLTNSEDSTGVQFNESAVQQLAEKKKKNIEKIDEASKKPTSVLREEETVEVSFGNDNKYVTAKLARKYKNHNWGITATSPFDKDDPGAVLGNLDGLVDKNKYSFFWNIKRDTSDKNPWRSSIDFEEKRSICVAYWAQYPDKKIQAENEYREKTGTSEAEEVPVDQICILANIEEDPDLANAFIDVLVDKSKISFGVFGIEASLSPENYTFYVADSLSDKKELDETSYSIDVFYRKTFGAIAYSSWTVGLTFEESYNESQEVTICSVFQAGGTDLICGPKRIGAPDKTEKNILYFDYGRLFNKQKAAMRVKISRDFKNDVTGVELPVWLVRDDNKALTGGIQFDWNSEDDDFSASLFITKPFDAL